MAWPDIGSFGAVVRRVQVQNPFSVCSRVHRPCAQMPQSFFQYRQVLQVGMSGRESTMGTGVRATPYSLGLWSYKLGYSCSRTFSARKPFGPSPMVKVTGDWDWS